MNHTFKHSLNSQVKISISGEAGIVIGCAVNTISKDQYLIRYKAADGRAQESWWFEDAIEAA